MKLVFLIVLLFTPFLSEALMITEVQIEGERVDNDYIILHNPSSEDINISRYAIRKRSSTGSESSIRVIPDNTFIDAKDYFVWASSKNNDFPEKVDADIYSTQYLSKNNSIAVINREGELITTLSWGDAQNSWDTPFGENPEKEQIIMREKINDEYKNTGDNSLDFYLYPPPEPPADIVNFINHSSNNKNPNPLLLAFPISLILGFLIIFLKRTIENVRT